MSNDDNRRGSRPGATVMDHRAGCGPSLSPSPLPLSPPPPPPISLSLMKRWLMVIAGEAADLVRQSWTTGLGLVPLSLSISLSPSLSPSPPPPPHPSLSDEEMADGGCRRGSRPGATVMDYRTGSGGAGHWGVHPARRHAGIDLWHHTGHRADQDADHGTVSIFSLL